MKPFSTLLLLIPLNLALPTPPPSSTDIPSAVDQQSTNYKRADDAGYSKYGAYGQYGKYSTYTGYDESIGSAGK
jgi:hypothetical protein